jgi:hypothetical protein
MTIKQQLIPLRIGKGQLCLLALFVMLLAPQGAWAAVYSTISSYTEVTATGYLKYYWNLNNDWKFEVHSDNYDTSTVGLASDPFGFTFTSDGGQICGLLGNGSEKITKVMLSGIDSNEKVTVTLKNKSDYSESDFLASTTVGEFYLPESETWNANGELYIDIDKACTITGVTIYTGTNYDDVIAWPDGPSYNGTTIQNAKQLNGAIVIDINSYTNFSYALGVGSSATVSYSSMDESVATVENSSVTIKKVGQTTIIAKVVNGDNYLNFSYQFVAVDGAYYGLIVAGEYVTANNASNITGDYIEGSTGALSYVDNTNTGTLTLKGVTITGNIIRTNNKGLTVYLDGNSTITFTPGNGARIFMGNNTEYPLLFSTNESNPGSLHIGGTGNINEFSSDWGAGSTRIWSKEDSDIKASEYSWWVNPDCYQMDLYTNKNYDLWIGDAQFCNALLSHYGGVEFKPASSTLELREEGPYDNPFSPYSFTSKLSALTVTVDGEVTMKAFHFVPMDGVTSGALTISPKKDYGTNTLKLTGVANSDGLITGFNTVNIANDNLTVDYSVIIGETNVTNKNASNVMSDQTASSVSFDPETNTLKLNNFVSETPDNIQLSNDGVLTIEINGSNTVGYIKGNYDSKLHVKKATGPTSPTYLEFVGNYADNGPVCNFIDCTWGDGLYMNSYTSDGGTPANYTSLSGTYYFNNRVDGRFVHPSNAIDKIVFSTEQEAVTPSIWIGNTEVNAQGDFVPSGQQVAIEGASFDKDNNVLTLSIINVEQPITSSLPNLTIKLAGDQNRLPKIISADPSATLTFVKDANTEGPSLLLQSTASSVISGFSSVTLGDGLYYESSSLLEYSTNARKFINPIDNSDITKLTISTNVTYPLWIAGTQVTSENASNVLADKYASVSYTNNTLTLKACQNDTRNLDYFVTIGDGEALTVHFIGYNNVGTGTKKFIYAKNACTVTFTTDITVSGLLEYIGTDLKTDNVTLVTDGLEVETYEDYTSIKSSTGIEDIDYFGLGIFESTTEVDGYTAKSGTSAYTGWYYSNAEMINEDANLPPIVTSTTVSPFVSRMKSNRGDIISDLTLGYDWGENNNTNVQVALTSLDGQTTYASGAMTAGKVTLTPTQNVSLADACLTFTSDNAFSFVPLAVKLTALPNVPYFYSDVVESTTTIGFEHDGGVVRYAIDYVSSDLQDVAETTWNNEPILIAGPCTVTAHVEKNGLSSATVTGRYFGYADIETVYSTSKVLNAPSLVPAAEGLTIYEYSEGGGVANFDQDNGNININGVGATVLTANFTYSGNDAVLNPEANVQIQTDTPVYSANLNITILPPAPTIAFDETKNYLNSDKVSISLPVSLVEDENATIMYSWDETCEPGNGTNYNSDSKVELNAGTNTLYAWVRYNGATADDALYSEKTSQEFTVKTDIAQFAVKDMIETELTYTGAEIVPTFTLYDEKEPTNTISSDNYDVRIEKYMGEDAGFSVVESIVNTGVYRVFAVGKGTTYGGEKLIYEVLEVNPAEITELTIATNSLTYTGEAQTVTITSVKAGELVLTTSDYDVSYEKMVVGQEPSPVDAPVETGTYNAVVTGKGNFTGTKSAEFTVLKDPEFCFYVGKKLSNGDTESYIYGEEQTLTELKRWDNGYLIDPTGFTITYTSSNANVATIDNTGKITIVGVGLTEIRASIEATGEYAADEAWFIMKVVPDVPQVSIPDGVYFTGQKLSITTDAQGGDLYYSYGYEEDESKRTRYAGEISLPAGEYEFYPYTCCGTVDNPIWSFTFATELYVYDEPTISKNAGEYEGDIEVEITNLPQPQSNNISVKVYYYLGDDLGENEENAKLYTAGDKITVRESTKLNVYLLVEGDSGKRYKTKVIERQYVIKDIPLDVTAADFHNHWMTYYHNNNGNVGLPENQNIGAYVATSISGNEIVVTQIKSIPRGEPVLLNDATTTTTTNVFGQDVQDNLLVHATEDVQLDEECDYYGLYNGAFERVKTIPAGKNYLMVSNAVVPGGHAPKLTIVFDNEATGVNDVRSKMEDVRGDIYDLQGRKVQKPSKKGLYINKGHKVVVK